MDLKIYNKRTTFANVAMNETFSDGTTLYRRIPETDKNGYKNNARTISGRQAYFWFNDNETVYVLDR